MTIKKTTQVGDPIIRTKAKLVKDVRSIEVKRVVKNLIDSMREQDLVGMAAPQIGESLRIFVTEIRKTKFRNSKDLDELRIFINPRPSALSKKMIKGWEGCGSVAETGLFATVSRHESVVVDALDDKGVESTLKAKGLLARVIQHEIDHLNGELFIDKADVKTYMSRSEYLKTQSK